MCCSLSVYHVELLKCLTDSPCWLTYSLRWLTYCGDSLTHYGDSLTHWLTVHCGDSLTHYGDSVSHWVDTLAPCVDLLWLTYWLWGLTNCKSLTGLLNGSWADLMSTWLTNWMLHWQTHSSTDSLTYILHPLMILLLTLMWVTHGQAHPGSLLHTNMAMVSLMI